MKCKSKIIKIIEDTIAIEDDGTDNVLVDHDETVYDLKVKTIFVDEGVTAKRFRARAKGRGDRILKRSCHVTIILAD